MPPSSIISRLPLIIALITLILFITILLTIHTHISEFPSSLHTHIPSTLHPHLPSAPLSPPSQNLREPSHLPQTRPTPGILFPSFNRSTDPNWSTTTIPTDVHDPNSPTIVVPEFWDGNVGFDEVIEGVTHWFTEGEVRGKTQHTHTYMTRLTHPNPLRTLTFLPTPTTPQLRPIIFISIASYRDYMCPLTVSNIFSMATYPYRLRIVIIQQNSPDGTDVTCSLPPSTSCSSTPSHPLCLHSSQVDLYSMDATIATGPTLARAVGSRMYRGEMYAMQVDAHLEFVKGWDEDIIMQHQKVRREGGGGGGEGGGKGRITRITHLHTHTHTHAHAHTHIHTHTHSYTHTHTLDQKQLRRPDYISIRHSR